MIMVFRVMAIAALQHTTEWTLIMTMLALRFNNTVVIAETFTNDIDNVVHM